PVPAGPRRELLQARAAFLSACGWGSRRSILASLEDRDRQMVQALKDGQQVVLWFEHDLYDQLQLADALALAAPVGTPELIVVDSFPGRPGFRGLGELTADELETLWPGRVPASQDMLAAAVSAWAAVRHPDPSALAAAAGADLPVEAAAGDPPPPPPPLGDPRAFARLPLRLTDTGQQVLDGRADRVALLGLDRWLGGTHLTPTAAWRWDPDARLLVRPAAQR